MQDKVTDKIRRARAYVADVRAGHVSFADEGAPFMTLCSYVDDLLEIIGQQARALPAGYESVLGQAMRDAIKWCDQQGGKDLAEQGRFYRAIARELGIPVDPR